MLFDAELGAKVGCSGRRHAQVDRLVEGRVRPRPLLLGCVADGKEELCGRILGLQPFESPGYFAHRRKLARLEHCLREHQGVLLARFAAIRGTRPLYRFIAKKVIRLPRQDVCENELVQGI